jgi:hypothetical protein
MANITRYQAQIRNKVAESLRESGRADIGDGCTITWNPCTDSRYRDPRYVYVSIVGPDIHDSQIFDCENGRFV